MTGRFDTKLLPEGLRATGYSVDGAILAIDAEIMDAEVICPGCGQRSSRRHGRYVRHLMDFPAHGRAVQVRLSVRRFRCVASHCSITTFSEKVPDCLACRHGRRTGRFQDLVAYLGRAMGGRPAQALGRRLRFGVSKDTFLRGAASGARTMGFEPRVIGIDDWAWRKGQRYGTLICDLERRAVIDLLPDREPATVAAWLRQHPQIEVVARDRNGGYRKAISEALPDATQVADRWHLLQNASDAFLAAVRRAMPVIRRTACSAELDPGILTAAER
ncbi:ISL3 family transposase, partial [Thioclava sp. 15-R06ZXC-3]